VQNNNTFYMKINAGLSILLITFLTVISGCGYNKELKKDVATFAEAVCKYNGVMNNLKAAVESEDSAAIAELQREEDQCQKEMAIINQKFQEKYKSKLSDTTFRKEYSEEIRKAILKCPNLSKEDRERFEKETD
jgi:hypothetical protein